MSIFERGLNFAILMRRMQLMQFDLLFFFPPTNQDLIFWKNQGYFLDFVQLQVCQLLPFTTSPDPPRSPSLRSFVQLQVCSNVFSCTSCSHSPRYPCWSHPQPSPSLFTSPNSCWSHPPSFHLSELFEGKSATLPGAFPQKRLLATLFELGNI